MPASMIRPDTGSRWKVNGSSIAIVAIGPMPGRTPMRVPIRAPISAKPRFAGVSATPNPIARLFRRSMDPSLPIRPDRYRQSETENEDDPGEGDEPERGRKRLADPDPARRQRADSDQQQDRHHEAQLLDR